MQNMFPQRALGWENRQIQIFGDVKDAIPKMSGLGFMFNLAFLQYYKPLGKMQKPRIKVHICAPLNMLEILFTPTSNPQICTHEKQYHNMVTVQIEMHKLRLVFIK